MEKKCFKCGLVKPLDEFYAHPAMSDGHVNKCKECNKIDVSKNYHARRAYYAEYEKQRNLNGDRKLKRMVYQKNRRLAHHDKYKAHCAVSNAVRDGRLIKGPCEVCGSLIAEGHHEDYSKPLEVRWLCRIHHLEAHNKESYQTLEVTP